MGIFRQFPYSNFHDMNMDQIIKIMREMQDEWAATQAQWASYKDFIDNYFTNLNVTDEVLSAMRVFAADGTLNTIMDPVIATETAQWLADHITATTGETVIDTSLSVAGAAADAKAAGDRINGINNDFNNIQAGYLPDHLVHNSYINASNGAFQNYSGWARTDKIPISKYRTITAKTNPASGYNAFYRQDGTFLEQVYVGTSDTLLIIPPAAYYVAFSNTEEGMSNFTASFVTKLEYKVETDLPKCVKADTTLSSAESYVAPYDDCDTFPNETIVAVAYEPTGLLDNAPLNFNGGTIITMNAAAVGTFTRCQLAIRRDGSIFSRHKWGDTWGPWKSSADALNQSKILNFSMFPTMGVIGDSFASGTILINSQTIWGQYPDYSWPAIVARNNGVTVRNYSGSGLSTRSWLTDTNVGMPKLLTETRQPLYLLCLGINDGAIYNEDPSYLGSIADIKPDYHNNPDTFYGNYGRIYAQIKEYAPNSKLVFICPPTYNMSAPRIFTAAIKEIAQHFSAPVIDSMDDEFFTSTFYQSHGTSNAHPVAMTYAGMAEAYNRLFSICVQQYYQYFIDVH